MNITVVGTGYVGLVTGTCFSEMGNKVTCIDIDKNKIEKLYQGYIPIFEPGLESLVTKNIKKNNLHFSTDLSSCLDDTDIIFIAVGTPMGEDGSADLQHVLAVAKEIGQKMNQELIIVDKSTVPVGTGDKVRKTIEKELNKRGLQVNFHVVSNPEFLKEGNAVNDFMKPDRVVIGASSEYAFNKMKELYSPFFRTHERFITMDIKSAEMTKYAANAMLATKISFINEIANICEKVSADVESVRIGIGADKRIGYEFIYPGCGYGGSCFPKDVQALCNTSKQFGYNAQLIEAVEEVNRKQKKVIVNKIEKCYGTDLTGKTFAIWGLSFKPGTDDMREAPSIYTINELIQRGAKIKAYDPKAIEEAKNHYFKDLNNITYVDNKYDALSDADALILLTEWKEFRSPNFYTIKDLLREPIIFDGRNQYLAYNLQEKGFNYHRIGK